MISKKEILHLIFVLFLPVLLFAQMPDNIKSQIDKFDEQIQSSLNSGNKSDAAGYYNKAAFLLWNNGAYNSALDYFENALKLSDEMNNMNGKMLIHNSMGLIYSDMESYKNAIPHLEKGLDISRRLKLKETTASTITNLAVAHQQLGQYSTAIFLLNESATMASELNDLKLLRRCYGLLYECYDKSGNSEEAYKYFELYSSFDREVKKVEMEQVKTQAQSDVQTAQAERHKTEQQLSATTNILRQTADSLEVAEKLTREQRLEIQLKQSEIEAEKAKTKARNQLIALIGIALLLTLVFLLVVFKQKNTLIRQKQQIENQNKNIKASIRYAKTIQNSILPGEKIKTDTFETFVMYRPKDIVSGDFYWYSQIENEKGNPMHFISVVDCTGHGVPGAFMSLIGNRLLSEIITEKKIYSPKDILENLNLEVRKALRQDETDNNDGMDLSFCLFERINDKDIKLIYAGAKRPLYYIFKETNEIGRIKGTRKSIGGVGKNKDSISFVESELILHEGDMLYMFSDGIVDQNDSERKRFGSQKLEELLLKMYTHNLDEQNKMLNNELDAFIKSEDQRDDITVMGLKIN